MLYECTWLCLLLLLLGAARGLSDGELASLHALYRAADGGAWDWRDSVPAGPVWAFDLRNQSDPCATVTDASLGPRAWQGVVCTRDPQECLTLPPLNCSVAALELASYSLEGTLPAALGEYPPPSPAPALTPGLLLLPLLREFAAPSEAGRDQQSTAR